MIRCSNPDFVIRDPFSVSSSCIKVRLVTCMKSLGGGLVFLLLLLPVPNSSCCCDSVDNFSLGMSAIQY